MLVLTRKVGEHISINDNAVVTLVEIDRNKVRIGFTTPRDAKILRQEVVQPQEWDRILAKSKGELPSDHQTEIARLKRLVMALATRCVGQSELLTGKAAKAGWDAAGFDAAYERLTEYACTGDLDKLATAAATA